MMNINSACACKIKKSLASKGWSQGFKGSRTQGLEGSSLKLIWNYGNDRLDTIFQNNTRILAAKCSCTLIHLHKPYSKLAIRKTKAIKYLEKYIYFDLDYHTVSYKLQPKPVHFKNFYEFEAQHFATRELVKR